MRRLSPAAVEEGECGILGRIFLAAARGAGAPRDRDVRRRHAVLARRALGVQQERRVDAGISEYQGVPVDADLLLHHRHDHVFGDIHELEYVNARVGAHAVEYGGEDLKRRVAGAGAESGHRSVDARRAGVHRGQRVGHAHRHIVMPVEPQFGLRFQPVPQRAQLGLHLVGEHVTGRVRAVDTVGAVGFHQPGLIEQIRRLDHVGHHQESDGVHLQFACQRDVLLGDVGLSAMGGDADGMDAAIKGHPQMIHGADAGQQQRRDLGILHVRDDRTQIFLVAGRGETIVDRCPPQTVAVGDLDQRYAGLVQRGRQGDHLLDTDLVSHRVHAVAQAHVMECDFPTFKIHRSIPRSGAHGAQLDCSAVDLFGKQLRGP